MFSLASGIYQNYFAIPQLNVLLIGAEGVGKTTLLERLKVTEFSRRNPTTPRHSIGGGQPPSSRGIRRLSCPAPSRYQQAVIDDEEDVKMKPQRQQSELLQRTKWLEEKQQSSLEEVEIVGRRQTPEDENNEDTITSATSTTTSSSLMADEMEYNVKPGHKMLPLEKIRPTSGQNLAKIDICGAKCHIFDLSGKFQELWARYYQDCDAVLFCWRLGWSTEAQRTLLEHVRKHVADDVPFLIFGHVLHHGAYPDLESLPTSTQLFLPHYTSNVMQIYCGSAKTGMGVREAMEWLIPMAKRQAKLRQVR